MQFDNEQRASRIVLHDGTIITKCDQCRTMHSERKPPTDPPCFDCKVELLPENREAICIYNLVKWQTITTTIGDKNFIDLNLESVIEAMRLFKVKDQKKCLLKVSNLFHHFIKKQCE